MLSGPLFVGCLVVGASAAVYRLFWRARYGRPISSSAVRLRGRAAAAPGSGADQPSRLMELRVDGRERHLIDLAGVPARRLRPGARVTVDALPAVLPAAEALYRSPACRPGLAAFRLARGAWPELRLLDLLLAVSLVGAGCTLPRLLKRPVTHTLADPVECPPGTRRGERDFIEWCERDREWKPVGGQDAVKHGPWRVRWEKGGIRQAGQFVDGKPEGEWTSFYRNGRMAERGPFVEGLKSGMWSRWSERGTPLAQECYRAGRYLAGVDAGLSPALDRPL